MAADRDFFPVELGNIWIYVIQPNSNPWLWADTATVVIPDDSIRVIDGTTYFSLSGFPEVLLPRDGIFRKDSRGDVWLRAGDPGLLTNAIGQVLSGLNNEETSRFSHFTELAARDGELLLYNFDQELPILAEDQQPWNPIVSLHELLYGGFVFREDPQVWGTEGPGAWRGFYYRDAYTSASLIFQDGIGVRRGSSSCNTCDNGGTNFELIWARVNGRQIGTHPGRKYPGYETAVSSETWGTIKDGERQLE